MSRKPEMNVPVVPTELEHYLHDDHVMETLERWQSTKKEDLLTEEIARTVKLPGDRSIRAVTLGPHHKSEVDDSTTLVMGLPHQQAWKDSMHLRAELMRQIVAPNSRLIVFPNNSYGEEIGISRSYTFTDTELVRLNNGDITPLAELQARALKVLKISRVALTGYSMGGLTAFSLAAIDSDLDISHINSDEMPTATRNAKQLGKDFQKSSGLPFATQLKAVRDSKIPAIRKTLSVPKLAVDYGYFGASLSMKENKAIQNAMAGTAEPLIEKALLNHSTAAVKIGRVAGSTMVDPRTIEDFGPEQGVYAVEYTGEGARLHTTGDNIVAHALMVKHGLDIVR